MQVHAWQQPAKLHKKTAVGCRDRESHHALGQRVHVVPVRRADVVALAQLPNDARGDRLLPAVEVHKSCAAG